MPIGCAGRGVCSRCLQRDRCGRRIRATLGNNAHGSHTRDNQCRCNHTVTKKGEFHSSAPRTSCINSPQRSIDRRNFLGTTQSVNKRSGRTGSTYLDGGLPLSNSILRPSGKVISFKYPKFRVPSLGRYRTTVRVSPILKRSLVIPARSKKPVG